MMESIEKYFFRNDGLIKALPAHVRRELEAVMTRKKIRKGRFLYRENTFPKAVYLIRKGKVKVFQTNKDGKEQIVYIYCKGEIMGYRPLICEQRHPVSAVALEDVSFSYIPGREFMRILDEYSAFSKELLRSFSNEFTVWVNNISVFAQKPVKQRVALALLILRQKYAEKGKPGDINLSREDFANYIGTVKETLVRVLQEFKKKKIVSTQGRRIRVLDAEELEIIADLS